MAYMGLKIIHIGILLFLLFFQPFYNFFFTPFLQQRHTITTEYNDLTYHLEAINLFCEYLNNSITGLTFPQQ